MRFVMIGIRINGNLIKLEQEQEIGTGDKIAYEVVTRPDEAAQQSVQRMRCTCRRNFEGAIIKIDPNCPLVQTAHR